MSLNIRGRCWLDGNQYVAEIPALNLSGNGKSMNDSLTSLKANLEGLSGKPVIINLAEGNCFLVSSEDPDFENFLVGLLRTR